MDFSAPYDRQAALGFLQEFLPDDCRVRTEENIPTGFTPRLIQSVARLAEVPSMNGLKIYEVRHRSDQDPRVSLSHEIFRFMTKHAIRRALVFFVSDQSTQYRLSLTSINLSLDEKGVTKSFSNPRRQSFLLGPEAKIKTPTIFLRTRGGVRKYEELEKRFSSDAVTDEFYNEFAPVFSELSSFAKETFDLEVDDPDGIDSFTLLFFIRIIFLGFVQKKGWLMNNERFLQDFWGQYKKDHFGEDTFHSGWLNTLFFEALNHKYSPKKHFSKELNDAFFLFPYLNGGLFRKKIIDKRGHHFPDRLIDKVFEFLFSYNFTVHENTLSEQELELNPELLGIIFERLVNKADGAVYTPRFEVDMMCRMSLVKWLEKKNNTEIIQKDLYELFFRERGLGDEFEDDQREGSFSKNQLRDMHDLLENIAVCDPAVGSGAFHVGMLFVLDEILQNIKRRLGEETHATSFERKKNIIERSLYGVEVKEWAVWITQLRLWITLLVEAPDELQTSPVPILPSLEFKVRRGDSLVQRIAGKPFPVVGHAQVSPSLKGKMTKLKKSKRDYYLNEIRDADAIKQAELELFQDILDEEISLRQKKIDGMKERQKNTFIQVALFKTMEKDEGEKQLSIFDSEIKLIEEEIAVFKQERRQISEEHPFIWNIEFADIFLERDGFDIVIGNPPYVRNEEIEDPMGLLDPKKYKASLIEMVEVDFSEYFRTRKVNGKSDLYTFFYLRGLRLLNAQGVHTFICTNTWLDAGYGSWLQEFLLHNCPLYSINDNHAKRSFEHADVNTIISILGAPNCVITGNDVLRFVAWKKSFEDSLLTDSLLSIETNIEIARSSELNIFPVSRQKLLNEGSRYLNPEMPELSEKEYIGDKWGGKYLRAPEIFFSIFARGKQFLSRLDNLLGGERYLNTGGADGFFIISNFEVSGKSNYRIINEKTLDDETNIFSGLIEAKYLCPLIKDITKTSKLIEIESYDALCVVITDEKPQPNIQKYIKWGELQGYQNRSVTKLQNPWYRPTKQMMKGAAILLPRSFNDTFVVHLNPKKSLSLRFYRLHPIEEKNSEALVGFLNSTLFWLIYESLGNKSQGQGVVDFHMEDLLQMEMPIILTKKILTPFTTLKKREMNNIFKECGIDPSSTTPIEEQIPHPLQDRASLDKIIFDALDLSPEERRQVYTGLCRLVWNRISRANSV